MKASQKLRTFYEWCRGESDGMFIHSKKYLSFLFFYKKFQKLFPDKLEQNCPLQHKESDAVITFIN